MRQGQVHNHVDELTSFQSAVASIKSDTAQTDPRPFLDGTVKLMILYVRSFWDGLGVVTAVLLGLGLGVVLGVVPHAVFGWPVMVPGLLIYFPFHAWLCLLMFSVLLSKEKRSSVMGEGYTPLGAFFGYLLTTKYGLFCISWFFTMWLYGASIIGV
jgi:hypothetical protein